MHSLISANKNITFTHPPVYMAVIKTLTVKWWALIHYDRLNLSSCRSLEWIKTGTILPTQRFPIALDL